jgi:hypothetical protein
MLVALHRSSRGRSPDIVVARTNFSFVALIYVAIFVC